MRVREPGPARPVVIARRILRAAVQHDHERCARRDPLRGLRPREGAGFPAEEVVGAIDRLIDAYLELRSSPEERFIDAYRRVGMAPFKAALYEAHA